LIYYVRRSRKPDTPLPPPPPPVDSTSSGNLQGANEFQPTEGPEEPSQDEEISREASHLPPSPAEAEPAEMPGETEKIKKDGEQSP
jgi:hypothetical protein